MLRLWLSVGAGVAVLLATALIASMASAQPQPGADPTSVIMAYETARNHRDVETALSYFADSAVVTQRNTTFAGKDDIRKFLDSAAARARFVVVSDRHVSGNHVSWVERLAAGSPQSSSPQPQGRSPGLAGTVLTANSFAINVEAVVQDGKIQSLAYTFGGQPAQPDPALDGRAQLPAVVGLGAVLTMLIGLLAIASVGLGKTSQVSSSLRGRLMHDLQGWASARQ
jgi:ketosteroid isomerase-like protein